MGKFFTPTYLAHPMSQDTVAAHLAPWDRPEVDAAVRPLMNSLLPEIGRLATGYYRRQRLTVPTLIVFGRQAGPFPQEVLERICRNPERFADHLEYAYVDDAAHFIVDDAPAAVAELALDWFARAG